MGRIQIAARFAIASLLLSLAACTTLPTSTITDASGRSAKVITLPITDRLRADGTPMDALEIATAKALGVPLDPLPPPNMLGCLIADIVTTAVGLGTGKLIELNPLGPYGASALATGTYIHLQENDDGSDAWLESQYFFAKVHCNAAWINGGQIVLAALLPIGL